MFVIKSTFREVGVKSTSDLNCVLDPSPLRSHYRDNRAAAAAAAATIDVKLTPDQTPTCYLLGTSRSRLSPLCLSTRSDISLKVRVDTYRLTQPRSRVLILTLAN